MRTINKRRKQMEAVIATLDTLWFGYPALLVILVFITRIVSGLTFRQLYAEIFGSQGAGEIDVDELVAEGYEIDDELEGRISNCDEVNSAEADIRNLVANHHYRNLVRFGEAGDW